MQLVAMPQLTVYRLKPEVLEAGDLGLDEFIDHAQWGERIDMTTDFEGDGFAARLYAVQGEPHEPRWLSFVRDGFGGQIEVAPQTAPGAAVLVSVVHDKEMAIFAFTFGVGRFLLKDESYVRNFGLRVALNSIFEGDVGDDAFDISRLRAVTSRRPSANTLRQQGQASREGGIEVFDLDLERDLMSGVSGRPQLDDKWGSQVSGSTALRLNVPITFDDLGALCEQLCVAHAATDYRHRFSWIDDVSRVEDPFTLSALEDALIAALRNEEIDDLELAIPEFVEWERVERFCLPYDGGRNPVFHPNLRLIDYLSNVKAHKGLAVLSRQLLANHRIDAIDGDGNRSYSWPVWRCLSGQLVHGATTFILDDGEFFEVSESYVASLDDFIRRNVPPTKLKLPVGLATEDEADYNAFAAEAADVLLMDRQLVRADRTKTAIELCDLLTVQQQLVHVKRKLGSSTLSHLFAQGFVSAELLLTDQQFRKERAKVIAKAVKARPARSKALGGPMDFIKADTTFTPSAFEVCFAIVGSWQKLDLAGRLPFFSKVNLRRVVTELQKMQFKVTHAQIEELAKTSRP